MKLHICNHIEERTLTKLLQVQLHRHNVFVSGKSYADGFRHVKNQTGFIAGTCTCCQLYKEHDIFVCACSLFYRKTGSITLIYVLSSSLHDRNSSCT